MTRYREITQGDLVADHMSASEIPTSDVEAVRLTVIDGDCYVLLTTTQPTGDGGWLAHTARLSPLDAKELAEDLTATADYLRLMDRRYNPQPF